MPQGHGLGSIATIVETVLSSGTIARVIYHSDYSPTQTAGPSQSAARRNNNSELSLFFSCQTSASISPTSHVIIGC
ncbi:hypothetical protein RRG08_001644 [Elysia crispata]|uniref:Uncharacterized protein n=1 Tax=Elysia crispata TaxID=231223 RepID=A0AAE1E003_9GAST|nr:hypothetical protein RRG08_001644 [Elysia crispata]